MNPTTNQRSPRKWARKQLDHNYTPLEWPHDYTMDDLMTDTSEALGIPVKMLMAQTQARQVCEARQIATYIAFRDKLTPNKTKIARYFTQHHSTVINSVAVVEFQRKHNEAIRNKYAAVMAIVRLSIKAWPASNRWAKQIPQL